MGLAEAGHTSVAMAEVWEPARRVLSSHFEGCDLLGDVRTVEALPEHDLLAAGFPCTDISPAGSGKGISGPNSGLVEHVFRLARRHRPSWVVLENVPNLLLLRKGEAIRSIVRSLEDLGYSWAYRTVDSRFTGLPQRRSRIVILASRTEQPAPRLFCQDAGPPHQSALNTNAFGFYWTEGRGGLGWAQDAIPTLKGGSTIGINSAPAVWLPEAEHGQRIVMPSITDGERLQGFPPHWTAAAIAAGDRNHRWKLVGNAVTVGVASWIGGVLANRTAAWDCASPASAVTVPERGWPAAAYGAAGQMWQVEASSWPLRQDYQHLREFLDLEAAQPLSHRAALGFLRRVDASTLHIDPRFRDDVERHVRHSRPSIPRSGRANRYGPDFAILPPGSWASSPEARRRMQANRGRDTKPELALRRELHARGLRYRVQARPTPDVKNRLDIVFGPARIAVDVRGCFWHSCREHATKPRANAERWLSKLQRNVERDDDLERRLSELGWHLEIVWEHEDPRIAADRIHALVHIRRG